MKNSKGNNFQIEPKTGITYIFSVPEVTYKNAFVVKSGPMMTFDLRQAGNARPYEVPEFIRRDYERKTGAI